MYGLQERDTLDEEVNEVIQYLTHCKKYSHVDTMMKLVRRHATLNERKKNKDRSFEQELRGDFRTERTLQLPETARAVRIEL